MSRRVLRKKKKKKNINVLALLFAGALIIGYLGVSAFFGGRFLPGTVIGDIKCGGKTPDQVRMLINEQCNNYTLTIVGRDNKQEILKAADIDLEFLLDDTISDVKKSQNPLLWIVSMWQTDSHKMVMETAYNEDKLDDFLEKSSFYNGSVQLSTNASNNIPDLFITKASIRIYIESLLDVLDLETAGCYPDYNEPEEPEIELTPFEKKVKEFTSAQITYDWHGMTEIVDERLIDTWLKKDEASETVTLDEQAVQEYVTSLSRKYDRFGSPRTFHTSKGEDLKIDVVCYGWRVNREKEAKALIEDIKNGAVVEREPEYLYTAYNKGEDDIGDSYVEIDLKNQHLYLYMDGQRVLESDFVSGNISKGFDTPDGIYPITYKERNTTLRGQGYASPVKYWMPFNGNVGMHDASWRSEFGGDIYLRNGSHGCINLPTSKAQQIYDYVSKGFPVIVYGAQSAKDKLPSKPNPDVTPGLEEGVPEVDPEILLQMQQMLLLQQQELQELQEQGIDTTEAAPPAGVDAATEPEPAPQEKSQPQEPRTPEEPEPEQ